MWHGASSRSCKVGTSLATGISTSRRGFKYFGREHDEAQFQKGWRQKPVRCAAQEPTWEGLGGNTPLSKYAYYHGLMTFTQVKHAPATAQSSAELSGIGTHSRRTAPSNELISVA